MKPVLEHSRIANSLSTSGVLQRLDNAWASGIPSVDSVVDCLGHEGVSHSVLAGVIKTDLNRRFRAGLPIEVAEYLAAFPELSSEKERVVSLLYEEFCLLEESGQPQDPSAFCEKYPQWGDSIRAQLRFHRLLSKAVVPFGSRPRFPEAGDYFGAYHLKRVLGRGGTGCVYLSYDEDLGGKPIAIKLSEDVGEEPSIMGRLSHPNIVPVYWVKREVETGLRGLAMPYLSGLPLDQVITRINLSSSPKSAMAIWKAIVPDNQSDLSDSLPNTAAWRDFPASGTYAQGVVWLIRSIALALDHAHRQGIEHRDVKPANILLTLNEGPQLLDFNLARSPELIATASHQGGTLPYMSPEQLHAFRGDPNYWDHVGPHSDVYSLGLVLVELLTGERPEIEEGFETIPLPRAINELLILRELPRKSLRAGHPDVTNALDAIIERCLAFDLSDRYKSAEELVEDLTRFLKFRPLLHAKNRSRAEVAQNLLRRNRRILWGVLLICCSIFVVTQVPNVCAYVSRRLYTVEQQPEFLEAARKVDSEKFDPVTDAAPWRSLVEMREWYPDSPLPLLYLMAIQEKLDSKALIHQSPTLPRVLRDGDARTEILKWGKQNPVFSGKLAPLALALQESFDAAIVDNRNPKETLQDGPWLLADIAYELRPRDPLAIYMVASHAFAKKDFQRSLNLIDTIVDEKKLPSLVKIKIPHLRVKNQMLLAQELLEKGDVNSLKEVITLSKDSIKILDSLGKGFENSRQNQFTYHYMKGLAHLLMLEASGLQSELTVFLPERALQMCNEALQSAHKLEVEDAAEAGKQNTETTLTDDLFRRFQALKRPTSK